MIKRKDDPPPETMSKASIVDKYLNRSVHNESLTDSISELANQLNMMSMKMHQNSEKQEMSKIYVEGEEAYKGQITWKIGKYCFELWLQSGKKYGLKSATNPQLIEYYK